MAYIITAVGAGGKTTYLRQRAQEYLRSGLSAAITTTTHIWPYPPFPHYYGTRQPSGKLAAPSREEFSRICEEYDVVLVEGDGSHSMPAKIPGENEPVIPEGTDEIVVVMGRHAVGRRLDVVCHRYDGGGRLSAICRKYNGGLAQIESCRAYDEGGAPIVTEELLRELAEKYYIDPLRSEYPNAKVSYYLSDMCHNDTYRYDNTKICAVLMASGFGRRYGGNKLLDQHCGRELYRHALDHVVQALGKENVVVVTQYPEIFRKVRESGIRAIQNDQAEEGISASIRLGTQAALEQGAEGVLFFAADMPNLPANEIRLYARQFLCSGKPYGCMVFGPEHICTNPGAFRLKEGAEKLLQLTGDRGAMRIMKQEPWNIYYYQIAPECVMDVDVKPAKLTT